MTETRPTPIVRQVEELGRALHTLALREVDASLAVLEQAVLEALRAAMAGLLEAVLRMTQRSLRSDDPHRQWPCPRCGVRRGVQSWRPRTVTTMCGTVTLERPWCHCVSCGHGFSPTDATLALPTGVRLSAGVTTWVATEGASGSFTAVAARLTRLAGVVVSAETVRQRTEACGAAIEREEQAAARHVVETREAAAPVVAAPGQLVVETDGVMVRYRDAWHEVKIGLVGGHEAGKLRAMTYTAARLGPEQFGPRLLAEAARRGALEVVAWEGSPLQPQLGVLRKVVVLGDGAPWIWHLAADQFGKERVEIVDFYHASQHLWAVAHALFGEPAAQGAWANARVTELLEQGIVPVQACIDRGNGSNS